MKAHELGFNKKQKEYVESLLMENIKYLDQILELKIEIRAMIINNYPPIKTNNINI